MVSVTGNIVAGGAESLTTKEMIFSEHTLTKWLARPEKKWFLKKQAFTVN